MSNKPYRRTVNIVVNNLLHTSHAINFLLYMYSAPSFRTELVKIFTDLKNKIITPKPVGTNKLNRTKKIDHSRRTDLKIEEKIHFLGPIDNNNNNINVDKIEIVECVK